MSKSLLEQLPEIAKRRQVAERILESLEGRHQVGLQTREWVLPARDSAAADWIAAGERQVHLAAGQSASRCCAHRAGRPQPLRGGESASLVFRVQVGQGSVTRARGLRRQHLAIVRHIVMNLLRLNTSRKASIKSKRMLAATIDAFRAELIGFMT